MAKLYGPTARANTAPTTRVSGITSGQLKTTGGLLKVAQKTGYGEQAQKLLQTTESPTKIFSGGPVQDILDSLNAVQHGVAGMIQGRGFLRGIETRASFSNQDSSGQFGIPGIVAGIMLDIVTDPLSYLGGFGVLTKAKRVVGTIEAVQKAKRAVSESRIGAYLGSKFIYRFGQDPVYKLLDTRREKNIGIAVQNIVEISKPLRQIDPKIRVLLTKTNEAGQTIRKSAEEVAETLAGLEPKVRQGVMKSYEQMAGIIDNLTGEYVRLKLLPADVQKNVGQYLRNQFRVHEVTAPGFYKTKPLRIDVNQFKKRKDIPEEIREQLGQIFDAGYLLPDTAVRMIRTVENTKFFNAIAKTFANSSDLGGMVKLPMSRGLRTSATREKIQYTI